MKSSRHEPDENREEINPDTLVITSLKEHAKEYWRKFIEEKNKEEQNEPNNF